MLRFKDFSIRRKLTMLLIGISMVAVLAACLSFYLLIVERYRQSYLDDLRSLADITGANCSASLAFGIPEDAKQLLGSLKGKSSITYATILDHNGVLFAEYSISEHSVKNSLASDSNFGEQRISQEITQNGSVIGTIVLYDDMRTFRDFKQTTLAIVAAIVFVVSLLTVFFAARLKEIISKPISNLADMAKEISIRQNFNLQAEKESADEIGGLVDAFNSMIGQIARRTGELEKSEQRFRTLINHAVDAFLLHDMEGRLIDVNPWACDSLGYSREELLGLTMADIDDMISYEQYRENYLKKLFPESPFTIESVFRRKDGMTFPVEMRLGLLELDQKKYVMVMARDVSERLEALKENEAMQTRLLQSQKMESIGTLAGGIAHDFNNILTGILGYTEMAIMKSEKGVSNAGDLRQVHEASKRASELVKQILTFSRQHQQEMVPLQIAMVVKEALKLLRSIIPTTIQIKQKIVSDGLVLADPTQIHQMVMNLCTNAFHAMQMKSETGVLTTTLHEGFFEFNGINEVNLPPGKYVKLEVSDTGCGMNEEIMSKIFEPYFTTKEQGKGTGLGLSVVHGIVKSHRGQILVSSKPGQGSTFTVYLPMTVGIEAAILAKPEILPMLRGNERVMVVDDEERIRMLFWELLTSAGYQVEAFSNGLDAWNAFWEAPNMRKWDLLITDQFMPMMTGAQLAEKVIKLRPDMPIILCTGYSERMSAKITSKIGLVGYLQKPISVNDLFRCVRAALDKTCS